MKTTDQRQIERREIFACQGNGLRIYEFCFVPVLISVDLGPAIDLTGTDDAIIPFKNEGRLIENDG